MPAERGDVIDLVLAQVDPAGFLGAGERGIVVISDCSPLLVDCLEKLDPRVKVLVVGGGFIPSPSPPIPKDDQMLELERRLVVGGRDVGVRDSTNGAMWYSKFATNRKGRRWG